MAAANFRHRVGEELINNRWCPQTNLKQSAILRAYHAGDRRAGSDRPCPCSLNSPGGSILTETNKRANGVREAISMDEHAVPAHIPAVSVVGLQLHDRKELDQAGNRRRIAVPRRRNGIWSVRSRRWRSQPVLV